MHLHVSSIVFYFRREGKLPQTKGQDVLGVSVNAERIVMQLKAFQFWEMLTKRQSARVSDSISSQG